MAIQIDEKTEVTLPLKLVLGLAIALVSASLFVFHIETRIDNIESSVTRRSVDWDAAGKFVTEFKPHPLVDETAVRVRQLELEIAKLQKDVEYIKKEK
jgi:hypothetical protein